MKFILPIILILIIGINANCQSDSIRGKQFQLIGKLENKVQMTPDCGTIAWGTVVEFQVIDLKDIVYSKKNSWIIITCPEFFKDNFFKKGKKYQILFSDKNQADFDWVIPNKDLLKKNELSFYPYAVSIKKLR